MNRLSILWKGVRRLVSSLAKLWQRPDKEWGAVLACPCGGVGRYRAPDGSSPSRDLVDRALIHAGWRQVSGTSRWLCPSCAARYAKQYALHRDFQFAKSLNSVEFKS